MKYLPVYLFLLLFSFNTNAQSNDGFILILDEKNTTEITETEVGEIRSKDKAFKSNCEYKKSIELLKEKARAVEANIIKITKHKKPDPFNSCHRFDAILYKAEKPRTYEKEILWSADRQLVWADYRSEKNLQTYNAAAVTYCGISYSLRAHTNMYAPTGTDYNIKATFYPEKSWVSEDSNNRTPSVLTHERKHFDLCEVYARKLYKALVEAKINVYTLDNANEIYQRVTDEYQDKQYQYDEETYNDDSEGTFQKKWNETIAKELQELEEYADHY